MAKKREPKIPVSMTQGRMLVRMLKLNSVSVSLIAVIVLGSFLVAQDVQTFLNQRRVIAEMEQSLELGRQSVEDMEAERDRWQDPVYIRSQARDRLYYVLPGEVSYLVMNADGMDLSDTSGTLGEILAEKRSADSISQEVLAAKDNWVDSVMESFLRAALDKPVETE